MKPIRTSRSAAYELARVEIGVRNKRRRSWYVERPEHALDAADIGPARFMPERESTGRAQMVAAAEDQQVEAPT
jgi:hypothetical protein